MAFSRLLLLVAALAFPGALAAAQAAEGAVVSEIHVTGMRSLSEKQILAVIRSREGEPLQPNIVNEDIKRIWRMGLFTDVKVDAKPSASGVTLTFEVVERPVVKELRFHGNKEVGDGSLKDKLTLKPGETYDQGKVAESVKAMEALYKEKNYYAVQVSAELKPAPEAGQVIVNFRVNEGLRMKVERIIVTGNKVFSSNRIKGQMKDTKEAGWLSGGSYEPEKVASDLENVLKLYVREGYAKAKLEGWTLDEFGDHSREVVRKATEFNESGKEIVIRFQVEEGRQYRLGTVSFSGNQLFTEKELREKLDSRGKEVFNKERWDNDESRLRSAYAEKGYIYAGITTGFQWDDERGEVSIKLDLSEGSKAYIEKIKIRGNDVTKDKVIRRELKIKEGDPFDSEAITRSRMQIFNLGFFENVGIDTQPGSEMDKLVLIFDVSPERKTGTLSVGAGYSSVEGLVGFLQVAQNNLFGNGQAVSAQWDFGDRKNSYSLSFTEPWLLDTPTTLGVDVYNILRTQAFAGQGYDQVSTGGSLRLGRKLSDEWKVFNTYRYQSDNTSNVRSDLTGIQAGIENISSITPSLVRDTRDNIFDANRGTYNILSVTLAGGYLGGDKHFVKPVFDSRVHFTTPAIFGWRWLNRFVLGLHARVGYATPYPAGPEFSQSGQTNSVPVSERFFMGGTDNVRGYIDRSLGAKEVREGGGLFTVLTNIEYGFKPAPPLKLRAFYDSGNAWTNIDQVDWNRPYLYPSVGVGMLFTIPTSVIQIRLDWGWGLDKEAFGYQDNGRIHFNIGNIF